MNEAKTALRNQLKQTRLGLKDSERTLKSRGIVARLKTLEDWSAVKSLHYFDPIRELLEVDLNDFITYLEDTYPDMSLFTPKLIKGSWHMVTAKGVAAPSQMDVVIVPMLGFDASLNRIGYGGGYYDKFLSTQTRAKKIGVCFEIGKMKRLPVEPHDIALDIIVTEAEVYTKKI